MGDAGLKPVQRNLPAAFGGGAVIGTLGGLIGLGGAEFRMPLLIGVFRFGALEAVILNKAMSLVVVATALPFRSGTVPLADITSHWFIILNLLAGSLAGAWLGRNKAFHLVMAAGSIVGTFIGGMLLGIVPSKLLLPVLAAILLVSAAKVWRH
jgi:uncharacterized protein